MTREHRSTVLGDVPRALPTTFTLREFARLLRSADRSELGALPRPPVDRARALVTLARATRGTVPAVPAEEDAVPDPISGGSEAHGETARVIDESVRTFLDLLVPPPLRPRFPPPGAGRPGPGRPPRPAPRPARPAPPPVGTSFTGPSGGPPAPRSADDPTGGAPPDPAADRRPDTSDDLAPAPSSPGA